MRKIVVASAALVVGLAAGSPAGAVNGPLDGNAHPNVGVMLVQDADGEIFEFCGGVLISPTVFLTNYNCPRAVAFARSIGGRAVITFEPVLPWPPVGSAFRTVEAGYIHPDANANNGTNLYGIAVLARPVRGIAPAELPTLHQLASIGKGEPLTVVGYGDNSRRSATVAIAKIDPDMITLLNNTSATGQGRRVRRRRLPVFPRGLQRRGRRGRRRNRARALQLDLVGVQERYGDGAVVLR
jgi:hypothetical protein